MSESTPSVVVMPPSSTRDRPATHLIDRVSKLPVVEAAVTQSARLYQRVKGSNVLVNWYLSSAEGVAKVALYISTSLATPLAFPIYVVDLTLCKGLDVIESRMPIIKEPPQEVFDAAKERVASVKNYSTSKVRSLADLSWQKANEVLATRLGNLAYTGFDSTSHVAEKCFDYCFPPTETNQQEEVSEEDPNGRVYHIVHTIGRLSNKVARRMYDCISTPVKSLNKDTFLEYISSLTALLSLTTYINALRQVGNKLSAGQSTTGEAQQSTTTVDGQQSTTGEARQQSTTGEAQQQSTTGEALQQSTTGEAQQQSTTGEAQQQSTTTGEAQQQSTTTGEAQQQSTTTGEAQQQSTTTGEAKKQSTTAGEAQKQSVATGEAQQSTTTSSEVQLFSTVSETQQSSTASETQQLTSDEAQPSTTTTTTTTTSGETEQTTTSDEALQPTSGVA